MLKRQFRLVIFEDELKVDIDEVIKNHKEIKYWAYIFHDGNNIVRPYYWIYLHFGNSSILNFFVADWFEINYLRVKECNFKITDSLYKLLCEDENTNIPLERLDKIKSNFKIDCDWLGRRFPVAR